jgi:glycerophosphoryl diester phosphodiesterase
MGGFSRRQGIRDNVEIIAITTPQSRNPTTPETQPCGPIRKLFAHRGGGKLAPENTIAGAASAAWRYGFHAVEFDVMLARDGMPAW